MVDTDDTRRTTDDGRRTTDDGRRTTPRVWHKLPTGELITNKCLIHHLTSCLFAALSNLSMRQIQYVIYLQKLPLILTDINWINYICLCNCTCCQ